MTDSGTGCAFCVICLLSAIIGFLNWPPPCTTLFRANRKSSTGHREATHGGRDFIWNKPGILLIEDFKGIIGLVDQCEIYPEPVAPISVVGLKKGQDFLIEIAVPGAASRLPSYFPWCSE